MAEAARARSAITVKAEVARGIVEVGVGGANATRRAAPTVRTASDGMMAGTTMSN